MRFLDNSYLSSLSAPDCVPCSGVSTEQDLNPGTLISELACVLPLCLGLALLFHLGLQDTKEPPEHPSPHHRTSCVGLSQVDFSLEVNKLPRKIGSSSCR